MRIKKKLALLLSAAMLVTSVNVTPLTTFAADGSNGTESTPATGSTKLTLDLSANNGYEGRNMPYISRSDIINSNNYIGDESEEDCSRDRTDKLKYKQIYYGKEGKKWYMLGIEDGALVLICDPSDNFGYTFYGPTKGDFDYPDSLLDEAMRKYYADTNHFSETEIGLMNEVSIYYPKAWNDPNGEQLSISRKMYAPSIKFTENKDPMSSKYIYAGKYEGSIKVRIDNKGIDTQEKYIYWTRTHSVEQSKNYLYVDSGNIDIWDIAMNDIVPVFHLNTSDILFASPAESAKANAAFADAMTIRFDGTDKLTSSCTASSAQIIVDNPTEGEYLYVQWNDGTDKIKSFQPTADKNVFSFEDGLPKDLKNCNIWIEKEVDNVTYAVINDHVHSKGTHHEAVEATCNETGTLEYWDCSCGEKLDASGNVLASTEVAATGKHNFSDQGDGTHICADCGVAEKHDFLLENGTNNGAEKCTLCNVKNIASSSLDIKATSTTYTGKEQTAVITGIEAENYTVTGNTATNAGKYTITLTGKGDYTGTREVEWTIMKATPTVISPTSANPKYAGESVKLVNPGSTDFGKMLYSIDNDDYSEEIPCADKGGDYTVYYEVEGSDNWSGAAGSVEIQVPVRVDVTVVGDGSVSGYDPDEFYLVGTELTLTAEPDEHYRFTGWDDDSDAPAERVWTVLADAKDNELTVNFQQKTHDFVAIEGDSENHKCSVCGTQRNHDFSDQQYINDGSGKHYQECKVCGAKSTSEAHSGGTATCTAKATCEKCGVAYGETGAHSFTNYVSNKDATCTADGTEKATCTVCGHVDTRTEVNSALGHSFSKGAVQTKCDRCDFTREATKEVENLTVTSVVGEAVLTWSAVPGAVKYAVYMKTSAGTTLLNSNVTTNSYKATGLAGGEKIGFTVRPYIDSWGSYSPVVWAMVHTPQTAVVSKVVVATDMNQATVSWSAVSGAREYALYQKNADGTTVLVSNGLTGTTYTVTGLADGARVGFIVRAKIGSTWYGYSTVTWVTLPAPAVPPTGVKAQGGDGCATVTWNEVPGAGRYALYQKSASGAVTLISAEVTGTSYEVTGLTNGETVGFVLKSRTSKGWSTWSATGWTKPQGGR